MTAGLVVRQVSILSPAADRDVDRGGTNRSLYSVGRGRQQPESLLFGYRELRKDPSIKISFHESAEVVGVVPWQGLRLPIEALVHMKNEELA
jgi:hypothetical protein